MAATPLQPKEVLTSPLGFEPLDWEDLWPLTNFGDVHVDGHHLRSYSYFERHEGGSLKVERLSKIERAVSSIDNTLTSAYEEEVLADVVGLSDVFAQDTDVLRCVRMLEDAIRDTHYKEAVVAVGGLNGLLAEELSVVWAHLYLTRQAQASTDTINNRLAIVRGFYVDQNDEFGLHSAMIIEGQSDKVGLAPVIGHQALGIYTESQA